MAWIDKAQSQSIVDLCSDHVDNRRDSTSYQRHKEHRKFFSYMEFDSEKQTELNPE